MKHGELKKVECRLEKITVHYEMIGEGRPIILFHGGMVDHRQMMSDFEPVFTGRDGWKRIYPDLPGMGRTPGMDWITNQDQVLDVVLDFIDHVIPAQRFAVAGMSYGGQVARGVVYRRTASIDGLLLLVPTMVPRDQRTLPPRITPVRDPTLLAELEPREQAFLDSFAVVQSRELLDSLRADVFPAIEIADRAFLKRLREKREYSFDVDALPERFASPTLILTGRQDAAVGYRDAWNVLENYPRATFVVLDRAGHGLAFEQKSLFTALVSEWLDRVEGYALVPASEPSA